MPPAYPCNPQNLSLDTSTTLLTDNRSHRYFRYTDNFVFVKRGFPKRPTLLKSVSEVIGVTADQRLIPRDEVKRRASSPAGTFRKIISSDSRLDLQKHQQRRARPKPAGASGSRRGVLAAHVVAMFTSVLLTAPTRPLVERCLRGIRSQEYL